jgi:hypothetical protein
MELNWTTIIASGVTASIIGIFQLISNRYGARMLDHIEKTLKELTKNGAK